MLDIGKIATSLYFDNTKTKADLMQCVPYYRNKPITDFTEIFRFGEGRLISCASYGDSYVAVNMRNEVTYYRPIRKQMFKYISNARLDEIINQQFIEPLLVFLDGKFVKWSDIYLFDDCRSTYFMINTKNTIAPDSYPSRVDVIHLPFFVSYTEDNKIFKDKELAFIFNENGLYDYEGHIRIYMNKNARMWYMEGRSALGSVKKVDLDLPDEVHVYPDNVFIFRNGLLDRDAVVDIDAYNALYIDKGQPLGADDITYKIFRDLSTTLEARNIDSIPNHDYLKHLEYNDQNIEVFKILSTEFDYKFDPNLDYNDNLRKFLLFSIKYNYRYLIDNIQYSHTKVVNYQLQSLWSRIDTNGCITLPYPKMFYSSCFPVVFINGYMCNRFIVKYNKNDFVFKLSVIEDNNLSMEVVFFRSYWDRPCIPYRYTEDKPSAYVFTDVSDLDIFSKYHPDKCFDMDDESKCFYTVNRSRYEYNGNMLTFKDNTFANQDLILVPRHRVVYGKFIMPTNNYRIVLGDKFNYCNKENLFMVFINGRKLSTSLYRVIVPSPVRPFNTRSIYFHRMLKAGDVVEVLYSNMTIIDEVHIGDLNHSMDAGSGIDALGYITGPSEYPIPLSKKLQFFFLNGRKVHSDHLKDISYSLMRVIKDYKSIENLCIINFEANIFEEVEDLKLVKSLLDETYGYFDKSETNNLTNCYAYINNTELVETADFDKEALIHQIIKDYYVHVNKGVPFRYTYDKETYTEVDADGNIILDVIDGTKYKSLEAKEVKSDGR